MASIVALMVEILLVLIIALPMVLGAIFAERKATQFTPSAGSIEGHRGCIDWFDYLSRGIVLSLMAYAAWFGWPVRLPLVAGFLIVYGALSFFRSAQEMLKTRAKFSIRNMLLLTAFVAICCGILRWIKQPPVAILLCVVALSLLSVVRRWCIIQKQLDAVRKSNLTPEI
jgi:hypothetical protein